jgi:hypothetical protein
MKICKISMKVKAVLNLSEMLVPSKIILFFLLVDL